MTHRALARKYGVGVRSSSLRGLVRALYKQLMKPLTREIYESALGGPAVVFSPHFDDETLGCGGTIIKKKRTGADLKVVFMTDGSKSHANLISEDRLRRIRSREGIAASQSLGLNMSDVLFLDFEETKLTEKAGSAVHKVLKILHAQKPAEVFIPYFKEPNLWSADHQATNRIVMFALRKQQRKVVIYEYPIWFWYEWPWVSIPAKKDHGRLTIFQKRLFTNLAFLRDFRCFVDISDVLDIKRSALNQYKSQMTQIIPDSRWPTLNDISNGEFLDLFFQDHEVFYRHSLDGNPV